MLLQLIRTHKIRTAVTTVLLFSIPAVVYFAIFLAKKPYTPHYRYNDSIATCRVPDLDPFDASVLPFVEPPEIIICSNRTLLTDTALEDGRQVLLVREEAIMEYDVTLETLQCCYSVIMRINDTANSESICVDFSRRVVLEFDVEFIFVSCINKTNNLTVYTNMHAVVQKKPSEASGNDVLKKTPRRLNVLLLGIDTMSRLNMMRTMPMTVEHLKANNWLEFRSYNKIGDNTVPNVLAILTGLEYEQLVSMKCTPEKGSHIDWCPYIWRDFRNSGYFTAYVEDDTSSTFNWQKGGFDEQPTDFYFRTFVTEAAKKLTEIVRFSFTLCMGPTSVTDNILRVALDLVKTHNQLFSYIWLNNFSHGNLNNAAAYDGHFLRFMKALEQSGAMDDTLVLFLSDHGMRFGDLRKTYVGWMEERLPFFFMWVPEWFKNVHPEAYRNLKAREDLLTSPYDLHLTLKEIVEEKIGQSKPGCQGCPTCTSLFTGPIVQDRSCRDAGVTSHWCACAPQVPVDNSSVLVVNASRHAVETINDKLKGTMCAHLTLNTIHSARRKESQSEEAKGYKEYAIVFGTLPGDALFEATVRVRKISGKEKYQVVGIKSMLNEYGMQNVCVSNLESIGGN